MPWSLYSSWIFRIEFWHLIAVLQVNQVHSHGSIGESCFLEDDALRSFGAFFHVRLSGWKITIVKLVYDVDKTNDNYQELRDQVSMA